VKIGELPVDLMADEPYSKYGASLVEDDWAALLICTLWRAKSTRGSRISTALCSQPTALSLYLCTCKITTATGWQPNCS